MRSEILPPPGPAAPEDWRPGEVPDPPATSAPLHLLRPFARWRWRGKGDITTVEQAEEYVAHIASLGFGEFYTGTARAPTRAREMKGGSLYFVRDKVTLFRMPFLRVEFDRETARRFQGEVLVIMRPELIRVERQHVGFLRGWRYLADEDAPRDLTAEEAALPQWYREGA
ncbi:MAG: DUF1489 family protein [Acidobacteria bacterium]|nr:DUF1489 family protein [Acidobacteriota bacterium]